MYRKENYHTYLYLVEESLTESTRIKDYLMDFHSYSSRLVRRIKREGAVYINGVSVTLNHKVYGGEEIIVDLGEEYIDVDPEAIPIDIVHEDDDILIVNKQPGIVTHITRSHPSGTLANAIASHWSKDNINSKIRFVNRLDRDTSGIVVVAKNKFAHQFIQSEMSKGKTEKVYMAVVENVPVERQGVICSPIGRPSPESIERKVMDDGKDAVTHYKVISESKSHCVVEVNLETGRTHQIRVHLKSIGIPIVGDNLYNEGSTKYFKRQALHSCKIEFMHPRNLKRVSYSAKLPEDLRRLIEDLKL